MALFKKMSPEEQEEKIRKFYEHMGETYPKKISTTEKKEESIYVEEEHNSKEEVVMNTELENVQEYINKLQQALSNAQRENVQLKQQIQVLQQKGANMSDSNQPVQTQQAIQQWEYMELQQNGDIINQLNKLGAEGWELVDGIKFHQDTTTVLKRPKQKKTTQKNDYYGYGR